MTRYDDFLDDFGGRLDEAAASAPRRRRPGRRPLIAVVVAASAAARRRRRPRGARRQPSRRRRPRRRGARPHGSDRAHRADGVAARGAARERSSTAFGHHPTPPRPSGGRPDDPPRWRMVTDVPPADPAKGIGKQFGPHGVTAGRVENAYADGRQSTYYADGDYLDVTTDVRHDGPAAPVPSIGGKPADPASRDPREREADRRRRRAGRRAGRAQAERRAGQHDREDDRHVLRRPRLVRADLRDHRRRPPGSSANLPANVELPVFATRFTVDAYDLLPDTPENETLLTIRTTPSTTVTTRDRGPGRSRHAQRGPGHPEGDAADHANTRVWKVGLRPPSDGGGGGASRP